MAQVYSACEAKAKFSEIIRTVQAGQRVIISYHGKQVAEIRPLEAPASLEESLQQFEADGVLGPPARCDGDLAAVAHRPGTSARFLESRE
jgi:prevent-host-death family protein